MNFKEAARKFFGIKTKEELEIKKTPKEKIKEFFESLLFAGIAALIIITFVIQNTRIPTGSMEDTILVGDFVLVNKFIYGSSSPKYIWFTEVELPFFSLPSFREPRRGDIVVFEYPGDKEQLRPNERLPGLQIPEEQYALNVNYVKRCIGLPGDSIEIKDKVVFINGKENWIPPFIKYLSPYPIPKDKVNPRIFPKGASWNEDNYGPIRVPKKGDVIKLTVDNIEQWRTIIDREFGARVVNANNNIITINKKPVTSYTIKKDYYFMMGDNRDDSADSRFWGYVSRDMIVGQAFIILFSWDRDIPFTDFFRLLGSIRLDRVLKLL